jgi:hypothetical protein
MQFILNSGIFLILIIFVVVNYYRISKHDNATKKLKLKDMKTQHDQQKYLIPVMGSRINKNESNIITNVNKIGKNTFNIKNEQGMQKRYNTNQDINIKNNRDDLIKNKENVEKMEKTFDDMVLTNNNELSKGVLNNTKNIEFSNGLIEMQNSKIENNYQKTREIVRNTDKIKINNARIEDLLKMYKEKEVNPSKGNTFQAILDSNILEDISTQLLDDINISLPKIENGADDIKNKVDELYRLIINIIAEYIIAYGSELQDILLKIDFKELLGPKNYEVILKNKTLPKIDALLLKRKDDKSLKNVTSELYIIINDFKLVFGDETFNIFKNVRHFLRIHIDDVYNRLDNIEKRLQL